MASMILIILSRPQPGMFNNPTKVCLHNHFLIAKHRESLSAICSQNISRLFSAPTITHTIKVHSGGKWLLYLYHSKCEWPCPKSEAMSCWLTRSCLNMPLQNFHRLCSGACVYIKSWKSNGGDGMRGSHDDSSLKRARVSSRWK